MRLVLIDAYHEPVELIISAVPEVNMRTNEALLGFHFKRADYDGQNDYLESVVWSDPLENGSDVNAAIDSFYSVSLEGFEMFIPKKRR